METHAKQTLTAPLTPASKELVLPAATALVSSVEAKLALLMMSAPQLLV